MAEHETDVDRLYGLVVQQPGKPQDLIARYVRLLLNFRYGMETQEVSTVAQGVAVLQEHADSVVCTFLIQGEEVNSRATIGTLTLRQKIPLLLQRFW